jgi:hypothetical protein
MNEEDLAFFYQEMQEQSNYEGDVIDWDDYSFGGTEVESYDP